MVRAGPPGIPLRIADAGQDTVTGETEFPPAFPHLFLLPPWTPKLSGNTVVAR